MSIRGVRNNWYVLVLSEYPRGPKFEASWEPLTFELQPVRILERLERVLRHKSLVCVKVLLSHQSERETIWGWSLACASNI